MTTTTPPAVGYVPALGAPIELVAVKPHGFWGVLVRPVLRVEPDVSLEELLDGAALDLCIAADLNEPLPPDDAEASLERAGWPVTELQAIADAALAGNPPAYYHGEVVRRRVTLHDVGDEWGVEAQEDNCERVTA